MLGFLYMEEDSSSRTMFRSLANVNIFFEVFFGTSLNELNHHRMEGPAGS